MLVEMFEREKKRRRAKRDFIHAGRHAVVAAGYCFVDGVLTLDGRKLCPSTERHLQLLKSN